MAPQLMTAENRGIDNCYGGLWEFRYEAEKAARRVRAVLPTAMVSVLRVDDWPSYAVTTWTDTDAFTLCNAAEFNAWLLSQGQ